MRTNKNGVNKDQKDKVKKDGYNRGQHCVYCLTYHMIFVTHYRKPVINDEMSAAMKEFSNHMAEQFRGKVLSAETDRDHIHLLVSLPPNTNISVFVRSIKTQLSREMRKRFPEQIKQYIYQRVRGKSQRDCGGHEKSVCCEAIVGRIIISAQTFWLSENPYRTDVCAG